MLIPRAQQSLLRVISTLQGEKLAHLRITFLHLVAPRPPMVGEVVAATARGPQVDERPERIGGTVDAGCCVLDVQVENDARPGLARPREKALVIFLMRRTVPYTTLALAAVSASRASSMNSARLVRGT